MCSCGNDCVDAVAEQVGYFSSFEADPANVSSDTDAFVVLGGRLFNVIDLSPEQRDLYEQAHSHGVNDAMRVTEAIADTFLNEGQDDEEGDAFDALEQDFDAFVALTNHNVAAIAGRHNDLVAVFTDLVSALEEDGILDGILL